MVTTTRSVSVRAQQAQLDQAKAVQAGSIKSVASATSATSTTSVAELGARAVKAGRKVSNLATTLPNITAYLLGRRITCMTVPAIVTAIEQACQQQRRLTVANYNVHSFNLSMHLHWFHDFLQNADITHCDGRGVLEALRFMGYQLSPEYRASYTDLMPSLLEHCNTHGYSMFLLGGKPETLATAMANIRSQYPNIRIEGHHGYFSFNNLRANQEIVAQINRSRANVLVVGMGMPIQERWIQLYQQHLNVNAILPGGAVIDRLAGIVPDCPSFLANSGLEWLFRLLREPQRLSTRYLLGIPAFGLQVALAKYLGFRHQPQDLKTIIAGSAFSNGMEPSRRLLPNQLTETGIQP
jgi:N-acetylglucosaminyldiphosphoundecaprenol N-acetyl-beta-D-mannosaminyltransferase